MCSTSENHRLRIPVQRKAKLSIHNFSDRISILNTWRDISSIDLLWVSFGYPWCVFLHVIYLCAGTGCSCRQSAVSKNYLSSVKNDEYVFITCLTSWTGINELGFQFQKNNLRSQKVVCFVLVFLWNLLTIIKIWNITILTGNIRWHEAW